MIRQTDHKNKPAMPGNQARHATLNDAARSIIILDDIYGRYRIMSGSVASLSWWRLKIG